LSRQTKEDDSGRNHSPGQGERGKRTVVARRKKKGKSRRSPEKGKVGIHQRQKGKETVSRSRADQSIGKEQKQDERVIEPGRGGVSPAKKTRRLQRNRGETWSKSDWDAAGPMLGERKSKEES